MIIYSEIIGFHVDNSLKEKQKKWLNIDLLKVKKIWNNMNVVLQNGGFLLEKISIMKCHEKRRAFNRELPSFTKFLLTAFFSVCRSFGS